MRIDLHTHSVVSDGTDTPAELVGRAAAAGLDVVALTDHDSTGGWDDAVSALPRGLRLVRGMEMSCEGRGEDGGPVAVHLLAYLFDPAEAGFVAERARLREERVSRIAAMAQRMADDGLPIDPREVLDRAGPSVGRPHLAQALVDAGIVPSIGDAFIELLSPDGPYFVRKADTPVAEAVAMVRDAGGVAVIAHPRARSRGRLMALDQIEELAELGLAGVEVHHPDHRDDDVRVLTGLAAASGLVVTGSSDYHGANKRIGLGEFTTAPEAFEELLDGATGVEVVVG